MMPNEIPPSRRFDPKTRHASAAAPWVHIAIVCMIVGLFFLTAKQTGGEITIVTVIYTAGATVLIIAGLRLWLGVLSPRGNQREL